MTDFDLGNGLKKVLLAGIGAVAVTVEKSQQVIDDLVKKGELTVDQGKQLNTELKRRAAAQGKQTPDAAPGAPASGAQQTPTDGAQVTAATGMTTSTTTWSTTPSRRRRSACSRASREAARPATSTT